MKRLLTALALAALAACAQKNPPQPELRGEITEAPAQTTTAVAADIPAGAYTLDKAHTSLLFRVNHLGFSHYTARFRRFDAQLQFDPAHLTATKLTAKVDARSIETDFPDPAQVDFNAQLQSEQWLNTAQFPEMAFQTTNVEDTGNNGMRVHGDLTLRGVTRPIVLDATFNGGYAGHPMDPHARIGFSAHGVLRRSEFGISLGIPAPGTTMGVGDEVEIVIESEFNGPPTRSAQAAPST